MDVGQILVFLLGISLLIGGAWILISGGTRVAAVLGVPPVIVGLTVVAFGTSAPELFVSAMGAWQGKTGLVLGNVIGSNVANLGLILALAAILRPVIVEKGLSRIEVPYLMVASLVFSFFAWNGELGFTGAVVMVAGFLLFMGWTIRNRDRGVVVAVPKEIPVVDPGHRTRETFVGLGLVGLGVVGLAGGGHFIVKSAVAMAQGLGVSEVFIGLTMVAVGTSLPELATTVIAAMREQDDLALGNIVGSNLFNLLAVAGPVGLFRNLEVDADQPSVPSYLGDISPIQTQLLSMLLLTFLVFLMILFGKGRIGRGRGVVLLVIYGIVMTVWASAG